VAGYDIRGLSHRINVGLLYTFVSIWPAGTPVPSDEQLSLFGLPFNFSIERRYLLIVVLSGALGSYVHLATSFSDYVGNRKLVSSWFWWYALRPFIGTTLAVMTYFVVRGGLILPNGSAGDLSPYGVAAMAGMAGMFSKHTDKLREVFENLFRTEKLTERADKLGAEGEPVATSKTTA
jgi:hypothetical protein